ncbi:hypothetical protein K432DRAFT_399815 [Lepidopterella palustris CBS 459.81]|uniref:Uncharacterized protein n=1 Tax=Lepidopterella palustris CBS 459.81 TaxID=1314670 RepID=A0A8E2JKN5_9PEZI|nr:hypothetical protein K432DRAFT_399815 [Lepidopterella palustris CBS 459.81]
MTREPSREHIRFREPQRAIGERTMVESLDAMRASDGGMGIQLGGFDGFHADIRRQQQNDTVPPGTHRGHTRFRELQRGVGGITDAIKDGSFGCSDRRQRNAIVPPESGIGFRDPDVVFDPDQMYFDSLIRDEDGNKDGDKDVEMEAAEGHVEMRGGEGNRKGTAKASAKGGGKGEERKNNKRKRKEMSENDERPPDVASRKKGKGNERAVE